MPFNEDRDASGLGEKSFLVFWIAENHEKNTTKEFFATATVLLGGFGFSYRVEDTDGASKLCDIL